MTTDRPDDRADEQIEAAAKVLFDYGDQDHGLGWGSLDIGLHAYRKLARALSDAGLLATPADQDALRLVNEGWPIVNPSRYAELKRAEAERDHAQERSELAEKDIRSAHFDAARALAERDQLRAQVAAVRALASEWEDDGPGCQLWPAYLRLRAALDTAGGDQP